MQFSDQNAARSCSGFADHESRHAIGLQTITAGDGLAL